MSTARLFVASPLVAGAELELPTASSRHVQVLRLQPGQPVVVFNGETDVEWPAEIVRIDRSGVVVRLGAALAVDRELAVGVALAVGMPANERMDALVEKATELGVAAIQPLVCARSVVRLSGERAEARRRHWQAVAASASEQCGRVRVPHVELPTRLDAWLRETGRPDAAAPPAHRFVLSLGAEALPLSVAWPRRADVSCPVVVLSGPEGGLTPAEEAAALAQGFEPVSLGRRVLRADTAPLAFLAWLGPALQESPP